METAPHGRSSLSCPEGPSPGHHRGGLLIFAVFDSGDDFVTANERDLPSAVLCFKDDFDAATAHLRFAVAHRKVIAPRTQ